MLNTPQREIVEYDKGGGLLVSAGPGSGKTRVIAHRIAHLIQSGVVPSKILALTFSKKAGITMLNRVKEVVSDKIILKGTKIPMIGTFHGISNNILKNIDNQKN